MAHWSRITSYPRILKELQFFAWLSPWPKAATHAIGRLYAPIISAAAVMMPAVISSAQSVTFSDGTLDPSNWTMTTITFGGGGTQTFSQIAGGNPDTCLRITNSVNPDDSTVFGFHFRNTATYDSSVAGAINAVDYSEDYRFVPPAPGGGCGQGAWFAIRQAGELYLAGFHCTTNTAWVQHPYTGLTADDFFNFDGNPANPDFSSSGSLIEFGFARGNSGSPGTVAQTIVADIDNWVVTVHYTPPPCTSGPDCNSNGTADDCDIAEGTSADCDTNGVPDECDPDYDGDGLIDPCDPDMDDDGVANAADVCDFTPAGAAVQPNGTLRSDIDGDCDVDLADHAIMAEEFTGPRT